MAVYSPCTVKSIARGPCPILVHASARVEAEFAHVAVSLRTRACEAKIHGTGNRNGTPFVEIVSDLGNDEEVPLMIEFPEYSDKWDIFAADIMFGELRVCFWRP